ncbi:MAG: hypothetical protein GC155_11745 [Alphaproteobacteria bacterium]|nr:hypothetical protein [Alphaproteobacteria bacterium]
MSGKLATLATLSLVLAACSAKAPSTATAPPSPGYSDASTSADIHAGLLTPGSDTLYAAESEPPATPEAWAKVEAGAEQLIEGAALMQTGSRPEGRAEWIRISKAVEDAARRSASAAHAHDADALAAADGDFTAQCEDCHNAFRDAGGGMMRKP